jgi:hypothetical protein
MVEGPKQTERKHRKREHCLGSEIELTWLVPMGAALEFLYVPYL